MNIMLKRPGQNSPQNMLDKFGVIELIHFERFCRDNLQWEEMKKCFATHSTVSVSWFQGTGQEFVEASKKMKAYIPHKLYNTEVWLHNNKAVAITMATISARMNLNGHLVELQSDVKLLYRTQQIDGLMYVVSMEGIYEKDALVPVTPNADISVPADEIAKFRSSYANLAYFSMIEGNKVSQELPGMDKPEMVNKLYQEADEWLNI